MIALLLALLCAQDVGALIKDLASDDPAVRDKATAKLVEAGEVARPALAEAAKSADAEVAARAKGALASLDRSRKAAQLRKALPAELVEQAPEIPDLLAGGTELDLLELVRKSRGVVVSSDGFGADFVKASFQLKPTLLAPVLEMIFETLRVQRKAGRSMPRLERVFIGALQRRGDHRDDTYVGGDAMIRAVRPRRLLEACLDPVDNGFLFDDLESLFERDLLYECADLIPRLLDHSSVELQRIGAKIAGRMGDRRFIPKLRTLLTSPSAGEYAIEPLVLLGDVESAPAIAAFDRDITTLRDLARLDALELAEPLAERLMEAAASKRDFYMSTIMEFRLESIKPRLAEWWASATDADDRSALLGGMSYFRIPEIDRIFEGVISERDLGNLKGKLAWVVANLNREDLLAKMLDRCEAGDRDTIFQCAFGYAVPPGVETLFLKALENPDAALIRTSGCERIQAAIPALLSLASGEDENLAAAAVTSLERMKAPGIERDLEGWRASKSEKVRRAARYAGVDRGMRIPREEILPDLESEDTRETALKALAKLYPAETRPLVLDLWNKASSKEMPGIAEIMGQIDRMQATAWMRGIVDLPTDDESELPRYKAAVRLAERGDPKVEEILSSGTFDHFDPASIAAVFSTSGHPAAGKWAYRIMFLDGGDTQYAPFELNAVAFPEVWERYKNMPLPAGAPASGSLDEMVAWLAARGIPIRWHPGVRPVLKADLLGPRSQNVLELLKNIHYRSPGSLVVFQEDGSIVLQTILSARRAWMDWWEKRQ